MMAKLWGCSKSESIFGVVAAAELGYDSDFADC